MASSVVTHFHGTHSLVNSPNIADHHRGTSLERTIGFDNQAFSTLDKTSRAEEFISALEKNLSRENGKSSLNALLRRILQLSASDKNAPVFAKITPAFFKQEGYLRRLFSKETWEQWTENRTPLGKVVSQLRDCTESHTEISKFEQSLDKSEIQQANEEAYALLKGLDQSRDTPMKTGLSLKDSDFLPRSSCVKGLLGGTAATLATKNPLPLLIGLSECLPKVFAQQKVGSEFQVNTVPFGSFPPQPSMTSFRNGNFFVTWHSSLSNEVHGQLFDINGNKIGSEFQINTYTVGTQRLPSAASLINDNFVVTWQSNLQDGSLDGIFGQLFDGSGNKIGSEFQVNTWTTNNQQWPTVVGLSNGNFVVAWSGAGWLDSSGIFGQLFDGNGNKIGSEFRINTYTNNLQSDPSIASFSNSNFVVAWNSLSQDGSSYGIYGQLFNPSGNKIGNEFQINTYTANNQDFPSIASLNNDNFVVSWTSRYQDGSEHGIFGQLFDNNSNKIGNEFQVNTYTIGAQSASSAESFTDGNFVVTWQSQDQDGSDEGIFGQLFDGTSNKIGSEFQVNTYTVLWQTFPSVVRLANGNFVITWIALAQQGIFGQIFDDLVTSSTTTITSSTSTSSTTSSSTSTTTTTSSTSTSTSSTTPTSSSTSTTSTSPTSSSTSTTSTTPPNVVSGASRTTPIGFPLTYAELSTLAQSIFRKIRGQPSRS